MYIKTYAIFDDKNLVKFFNIGRALTNQLKKDMKEKICIGHYLWRHGALLRYL